MIILGFLTLAVVVAMLIIYVEYKNEQLDESNESHIKLLNGMHEGLLILSRNADVNKPTRIQFCN